MEDGKRHYAQRERKRDWLSIEAGEADPEHQNVPDSGAGNKKEWNAFPIG